MIAADGEKKASRCIKEAADVLTESPASIQLRYLQTLHSISEEQNHTIVVPLPTSLLSNFGLGSGLQQASFRPKLPVPPASQQSEGQLADGRQQAVSDQLIDLGGVNTQF